MHLYAGRRRWVNLARKSFLHLPPPREIKRVSGFLLREFGDDYFFRAVLSSEPRPCGEDFPTTRRNKLKSRRAGLRSCNLRGEKKPVEANGSHRRPRTRRTIERATGDVLRRDSSESGSSRIQFPQFRVLVEATAFQRSFPLAAKKVESFARASNVSRLPCHAFEVVLVDPRNALKVLLLLNGRRGEKEQRPRDTRDYMFFHLLIFSVYQLIYTPYILVLRHRHMAFNVRVR
ncbi:hypothetical protein PUN28_016169 [Cardiocondyla obscurior]|uniref:Uncharacterized protein n=1 Tax=Cardiocondyla obscurior TaxID=286306 RepID=A0AAW2ETN4_9HYME